MALVGADKHIATAWVTHIHLFRLEELLVVYLYLANRANRSGECWPAIPTIAQELKLSQATVRRAIRDLEREDLLKTVQRYRPNGGKSSLLYSLPAAQKATD